ncbi:hypothetical protein MIS45_09735 [Wielerella bovis]|uniref:virulence factor TspB C-terminal domain-related protein n=1 Tax=Wielerella bovis TaxID=2917790 RepID=UPI002018536F|nr:virulence factor TspB C-terminal domain-related protein [Wielerella bovis]ULJ69023.1 hypothetical protein MIS45_09735 [Wielerella bovis]
MKLFRILIPFFLFVSLNSFADTAYIPPNTPQAVITRTANGNPIHVKTPIRGGATYSGSLDSGLTINVPNKQFNSVKAQNGNVTATKTHPATFTDSHGAKATGTVNTQTNVGKMSNLSKGFATYAGVSIAGAVVNSPHAQQAAQSLGQGDYGKAAAHATAAFDFSGLGSGLYGLFDIFQNARAGKEMGKAVQNAAAQKAQAAAQQAEQQRKNNEDFNKYLPNPATGKPAVYPKLLITEGYYGGHVKILPHDSNIGQGGTKSGHFFQEINWGFGDWNCYSRSCYPPSGTTWHSVQVTEKNYDQYKDAIAQAINSSPNTLTLEDFLLNQQEIMAIIADYLDKNLAQNQALTEAITNMMWQLGAGNGGIGAENTQTTIVGSQADNTFVSPPYTPAGSNQAQQTQFVVNQDGSVTTSTIPRPDLNAHTSQAPTRHPIGQNTSSTQSQTETPKSQSTASAPDICAMNPNSLMCSPLGNMDYEDIKLPTNTVNISLNPLNIFQTTGVCPPPEELNLLGNRFLFSYQPMCDGALKLRPWLIFLAMILSFLIVKDSIERQ